jgi:hypothetical protein
VQRRGRQHARFGLIFGFPFRLGAPVGLLFFKAFFAGRPALFNHSGQKVMDEFVAGAFATAKRTKEPLVDQIIQATSSGGGIPKTGGMSVIPSAANLAPVLEDSAGEFRERLMFNDLNKEAEEPVCKAQAKDQEVALLERFG